MLTKHHSPRSGRTAALLAVVLPLLAACTNAPGDNTGSDGPVSFVGDKSFVQTAGVHADAGEKVVFGATTVRNHGTESVTLTGGTLGGAQTAADGARVSTVRVLDTGTGSVDLVGAAVWPFEDHKQRSVPLKGYTLKAGAEAELLFVVSVDRTGEWFWPTTSVQYDSGTGSYQDQTNFGFMVCPRHVDTCEPPR